jgi:hypothetical protein
VHRAHANWFRRVLPHDAALLYLCAATYAPFVTEEFSQYEVVRSFAAAWSRATLRQAKRYRAAVEVANRKSWQYDRLEDWSPQWPEVVAALDDAWTEGHLLVVAAHKLDVWVRRLAVEAGRADVPIADRLLNDLRDALEHLDEAMFEDGEPVADPSRGNRKWALDRLPRSPGAAHTTRAGELFALGLISVDHLESLAHQVANEIEDEIEAPAIDAYIQSEIDRRLGK